MRFSIPASLVNEHAEFEAALERAARVEGAIGKAASEVVALLHPHFETEEAFVLPPLGLLRALADGPATPEMKDILVATDELAVQLPQMLIEHQAIVRALEALAAAATLERQAEWTRLADELTWHAQTEEEIFYPAAILVGTHIRRTLMSSGG